MKLLVSQTLAIALSQNGVREINHSNTGPMVDLYLAAANEPPGEPWCASFGVWCIKQACDLLGLPYPAIVSGYCPDWYDWGKAKGILHTTPQPGDICLVDEGNGYHHFLFVVDVKATYFDSIEGNTNDDGSAEGDGVYHRQRAFSSRYIFLRLADLLPADDFYSLQLNGKPVTYNGQPVQMPVVKSLAMCPARPWAAALGFPIGFEAPDTVSVAGARFPGALMLRDLATGAESSYVPIKTLANQAGLLVTGDVDKRIVNVSHH